MELPEIVRTLLARRGLNSEAHIAEFLDPDYDLHTHDPFLLSGMEEAVARVLRAIQAGERIAVYADFDSDGIPGAAVLSDLFAKIGYGNVEVYIPHRDREGYGFHTAAIEELATRGVSLIITVDVGTTAVDAVRFARERGIEVVVTDHHEIIGALPECIVLNPKLGDYPFCDLCGAAVAFKLAQSLIRRGREAGLGGFTSIREGWEKWLLDLVAIATVADMVPLLGENRVLVRYGLYVLRRSPRPGLNALVGRLRLKKAELTEDDIGFSIAPRINAASRMDEPDLALKLLTTQDADEAERLSAHLEHLNAKRKGVVAGIVRQARAHARTRFTEADTVVVLGDPEWKPALLGLAANSLVGDRGGVVCLWGRDAKGEIKGSCRSDGSVSLVDLFGQARDAFIECGGHAYSGGFSVSSEQVHSLCEALKEAAARVSRASVERGVLDPDLRLTLPEVSRTLYADVSRLAPFGTGNPKPVLHVRDTVITGLRRFGKEQAHLELTLECRASGRTLRAFDFFRDPGSFSLAPAQGTRASILGTIEKDSYRGGLSLRIVDVVSA